MLISDAPGGSEQDPRQAAVAVGRGFVVLAALSIVVGLAVTYLGVLESLRSWELSVNERLVEGRSSNLDSIARVISRIGDTFGVIGLVVLISVALAFARQRRMALLLPAALLIEVSTFLTVNYVVQCPRADVPPVASVPSTFSFPSGHVAATPVC